MFVTAICDSNPRPEDLVMSYNFGNLVSWYNHINNSIQMSPCDDTILHGVFDFGFNPAICTFQDSVSFRIFPTSTFQYPTV